MKAAATTSAECRTLLSDGSTLTVTATRRPRGNRADVKCIVAAAPSVCERMQEVVRLARLTEPRIDSREQIVIGMDRVPAATERDWELAVVLADRLVRGLVQAPKPLYANGWSEHWHLGRIDGHDLSKARDAQHLLGGAGQLAYLGALSGHPDPSASVSTARAWFPLHSGGINDALCWVEVSVFPATEAAAQEEDSIAAPSLDLVQQQAVRSALTAARHMDARSLGRWRTVVRFGQSRFHGNSYELALVMADRIARGREFLARGRLIATGCSGAWHAGRVDSVEGLAPKCALIAREAQAGDRVLLPKAWEPELAPDFGAALREKGARLACVEKLAMI